MKTIKENSTFNNIIGIKREAKYIWERRVALTPQNCKKLIQEGVKLIVQPSKLRCYTDDEYLEIGAEINEDLSSCHIIVGIQDILPEDLLRDKTYLFFSHSLKAQPDKKDLILKLKILNNRFIDYEAIRTNKDQKNKNLGKRLVSFGRIAGVAGTINILSGIGQLLLSRNISNQFLYTKLGYMHCNLQEALDEIKKLGELISLQFLPNEICPFIVGVLGTGQVGTGVIEALKHLPHKILSPKDLAAGNYTVMRDCIYIVIFNTDELYENKKTGKFDPIEYNTSPEMYVSKFSDKYLDKLTLVINCLYWEKRYPRIISKSQLKNLFFKKKMNLLGISDISCDINGSIEFLDTYNSNTKPFFIYEPLQMIQVNLVDDATKDGIVFSAIPYLAASFSYDASDYFSNLLFPFLQELVKSQYPHPEKEGFKFSEELNNAIIISNGNIVNYVYNLTFSLQQQSSRKKSSQISFNRDACNIKLVGHLLDRKVYNDIILLLLENKIDFEVITAKIGWLNSDYSTLYLSIFKEDIVVFEKCMAGIKEIVKERECEIQILEI